MRTRRRVAPVLAGHRARHEPRRQQRHDTERAILARARVTARSRSSIAPILRDRQGLSRAAILPGMAIRTDGGAVRASSVTLVWESRWAPRPGRCWAMRSTGSGPAGAGRRRRLRARRGAHHDEQGRGRDQAALAAHLQHRAADGPVRLAARSDLRPGRGPAHRDHQRHASACWACAREGGHRALRRRRAGRAVRSSTPVWTGGRRGGGGDRLPRGRRDRLSRRPSSA